MGHLYAFGFLLALLLVKSDAAITWTTPATGGTPTACPILSTVAEGTTTGVLITISVATDGKDLTKAVADTTNFDITGDTVFIKSTAKLDFEAGASVNVVMVANDDGKTAVSATCTIAITDVQPEFIDISEKVIIPESAANDSSIASLFCTDGATTSNTLAMTGGDDNTAKFVFDTGTGDKGALKKSANAFDAATKAAYILTFTCVEGAHTASATMTVCLNSESNCPSSKASINNGVLAGLVIPTLLAMYHLI